MRDIAWKAQARLTERYRAMTARGKRTTAATTAIARELTAFMWTIPKLPPRLPEEVSLAADASIGGGMARNGEFPPARRGRLDGRRSCKRGPAPHEHMDMR